MRGDEYDALCLCVGTLALAAVPFAALGWWVSWWLAGGLFSAGVAGAVWWISRWLDAPS